MDITNAKNNLNNGEGLQRMDDDTALEWVFQNANKVIVSNESIKTPMNIKSRAEKRGNTINLPQKHAKLLKIIQTINPSGTFTDEKTSMYLEPITTINCST